MSCLRSLITAFSTYSRIPMPRIAWREENLRYAICFFPLVGAVIGAAEFFWFAAAERFGLGRVFTAAVAALIPLLLSGGIHMDGLMDTADALGSRAEREKKLQILKDSHAGAFAVMACAAYLLLYFAALCEISGYKAVLLMASGFTASRALSAVALTAFKKARPDGLLRSFSDAAREKWVYAASAVYLAAVLCLCLFLGPAALLAPALAAALFFYYRRVAYREFGGVTGDLAGWFTELAELAFALAAAAVGRFL